jgi:hypothetical protein
MRAGSCYLEYPIVLMGPPNSVTPSSTTRFPEHFSRRHVIACLLILAVLAGAGGYFKMISSYQIQDDEGMLMLGVKQNIEGMRLYRDILTIFGPVYYFYNDAVRIVTGTPVTHDSTRLSSIFPWFLCSLLSAYVVLKLTQSLVFAGLALYAVSKRLIFWDSEPGHTHELTLVLLTALMALPLYAPIARRRPLLMASMGALAGAMLLIKVNIGGFVLVGLALALAPHIQPARLGRFLAGGLGFACIVMPAALMRHHIDAGWVQTYCVIATASLAAAVCCLPVQPQEGVTWRDAAWIGTGCLAVLAAALAVLFYQGVSLSAIFDCVVLLPERVLVVHRNWFFAAHFSRLWTVWAAVGGGLGVFVAWKRLLFEECAWLFWLKAAFSATALMVVVLRGDVFPLAAPVLWLMLVNPGAVERKTQALPRGVLYSITIVHTLYGYPAYASQGNMIQVLLLIAVLVCAADSLFALLPATPGESWWAQHGRAAAAVALVGVAVHACVIDYRRWVNYRAMPSLDLPGAHLVHVWPEQKIILNALVAQMKSSCDVFEGFPGLPSFYFWTGMKPLTGYNLQCWQLYYTDAQQQQIIGALSAHPRACIVYHPRLVKLWNPGGEQDVEALPLVRYIRRSFKPLMSSGDYQLLVRNERQ